MLTIFVDREKKHFLTQTCEIIWYISTSNKRWTRSPSFHLNFVEKFFPLICRKPFKNPNLWNLMIESVCLCFISVFVSKSKWFVIIFQELDGNYMYVLKTMVIEIEKKKERDRERMTENDWEYCAYASLPYFSINLLT